MHHVERCTDYIMMLLSPKKVSVGHWPLLWVHARRGDYRTAAGDIPFNHNNYIIYSLNNLETTARRIQSDGS